MISGDAILLLNGEQHISEVTLLIMMKHRFSSLMVAYYLVKQLVPPFVCLMNPVAQEPSSDEESA
jgi:hypothetical protein